MDDLMNYDNEIQSMVDENEQRIEEIVLLLLLLKQKSYLSKRDTDRVLAEINAKLKMLDSYNQKWAEKQVKSATQDGTVYALIALGILFKNGSPSRMDWMKARDSISINQSNRAMMKAAITSLENDLKSVTDNIKRRAQQSVREILAENFRRELVNKRLDANAAVHNTIAILKQQYGDKVNHVLTDSLGRKWKADHYVSMIANTTLMEVQNRASINEGISRGFGYGRITSAPNTKDSCAQYEGKIIKLDESVPGDYPTYDELRSSGKIFHPNCRHRIEPIFEP